MMRKVIAGLLLCSLLGLEAATISGKTKDIIIPSVRPAPIPIVRPQAPTWKLPNQNAEAPLLELPVRPVITLPGVVPVNPEAPLLELPENPVVTLPGVVPVDPEAPLLELPESPVVTLPGVVPVNPEAPILELPESPVVTLPGVVPVNPEAPILELPESPVVTLPGVVPVNPEAPILELPESPVVTLPGVVPVNPVNPILELPEKQLSNLMQELKNAINNGKHAIANPGSTSSFIGSVDRIGQIFAAAQQVVDYAKEKNCETLIPPLGVYQIRAYTTHNKCQSHFFQQRDEALTTLDNELPLASAYYSDLFKQILICGGKQSETSQCFAELYSMNKENTQGLVQDIKKNVGLIDTYAIKIKGCQAHNEKLVKEELNELLASAKQCVSEVPELNTPEIPELITPEIPELITPEAPVLELPESGIVTLPEKLPGPPIVTLPGELPYEPENPIIELPESPVVTLPGEIPVNPVNPILELPEKQLSNLMQELKNAINNGKHAIANPGTTSSFIGVVDRIAIIFTAAQQVVDYAKEKNCETLIPSLGVYQIRAYLTHNKCQSHFFQQRDGALATLDKELPLASAYHSDLFKQILICGGKQSETSQCFAQLYSMNKENTQALVQDIKKNVGLIDTYAIKIKGCQAHNEKLVKEELNELLASAKQCVGEVPELITPEAPVLELPETGIVTLPEKLPGPPIVTLPGELPHEPETPLIEVPEQLLSNIMKELQNLINEGERVISYPASNSNFIGSVDKIGQIFTVGQQVVDHAKGKNCGPVIPPLGIYQIRAYLTHNKCQTYFLQETETALSELIKLVPETKNYRSALFKQIFVCAAKQSAASQCFEELYTMHKSFALSQVSSITSNIAKVTNMANKIKGCQDHNEKLVKEELNEILGPLKQCVSEVADEAFPKKIEQFENILTESLNLANRKIFNNKALKQSEIDEVLQVAKSVITHAIDNQCGGSLESYEALEQEALTAHRKCKTYYDDKNEVAKTQLRGQALLGKFLLNKINSKVNQCANDASCLNQLSAQEGPSIDVAIQKLQFLTIPVSKHQDNITGCQSHNLKLVKSKVEDLLVPLKQCSNNIF